MGEAANCSYVDAATGQAVLLECAKDQTFCCPLDGVLACSANACSSSPSSQTDTLSNFIFWVILAALAGLLFIVLFITYLVCRFRKNKFDYLDGKRDSVFEETVCESEIRTIAKREKPLQSGTTRLPLQVREATEDHRVLQVTPRPSRLPVRPINAQNGSPRPNQNAARDGGVSPAWSRVNTLLQQKQLTMGSRNSPSMSRVSALVHQHHKQQQQQHHSPHQQQQMRGRDARSNSPGWSRLNSLTHSNSCDGSPTASETPRAARRVSPREVLPAVV